MTYGFLYSQDLSNCTTVSNLITDMTLFLYSQDLSNCTTISIMCRAISTFLYSQDLSNCTTPLAVVIVEFRFCTLKI